MGERIAEQRVSGPLLELFAHDAGHADITRLLNAIRKHLGMDVAFISHFRETDRVLENVSSEGHAPLFEGQTVPLSDGYCMKIVRGELPQLIADTARVPAAVEIEATRQIPVGAHLGVPIVLEDGAVYGTLCCFSYKPDPTLGDRELKTMLVFADVLASRISEIQEAAKIAAEKEAAIKAAIRDGAPRMVHQPLYELSTGRLALLECLSRFDEKPHLVPEKWFSMAYDVGLGRELELVAIRKAVSSLAELPGYICIAVNASPGLVMSGELLTLLENVDASRIVLEITEHAIVDDYQQLGAALLPLRERGLKLAIDDAGAGYASMRHIVDLHPDLIKLDMSLTRNIDTDSNRRALARALISFSKEIGAEISAEGVETEGELRMLQSLGVNKAQGYFLGRPTTLKEALNLRLENVEAWLVSGVSEFAASAA